LNLPTMSKFAPHSRSHNTPRATSSTVCQKCLKTGHFIYECKSTRPYVSRPSRTQLLEKPALLAKMKASAPEVPEEFKSQSGTANKILEAKEKERENKQKGKGKAKDKSSKRPKRSSPSGSDSDSDSDSDSSSDSDSDSSSSSSSGSSRSRERDRKRRTPHSRERSQSSSSSSSSDSEPSHT